MHPAKTWMIAKDCHDSAHGYMRRPFSEATKAAWRYLVILWPQQGALTYSEVRRIAEALGREPDHPKDDEALRIEFARRLRAEALRLDRPHFTKDQIIHGRIKRLAEM